MSNRSAFVTVVIALLLACANERIYAQTPANQQAPFSFTTDNSRIYFAANSLIKSVRLEGYTLAEQKAFDSGLLSGQPLRWQLQDEQGSALADDSYVCFITLTYVTGRTVKIFGELAKDRGAVAFSQANEIFERGVIEPASFFARVTEIAPDNAMGWLYYGMALRKTFRTPDRGPFLFLEWYSQKTTYRFSPGGVLELEPELQPEPEPLTKLETLSHKIKSKRREPTYKAAIKAFEKADDLAEICLVKSAAHAYLAELHRELKDYAKHHEYLLKLTSGECATTEIDHLLHLLGVDHNWHASQSSAYYLLGVDYYWRARAITESYADKTKLADPYHARDISRAEDKQKFDEYVGKGMEYMDKVTPLDPASTAAIALYKGRFCREKQKVARDAAERRKWEAEAERLEAEAEKLRNKR